MVLTALGSGLLSAGTSLLGNLLGFGAQERANKQNMKLAEYQYSKNLEMWNRNNAYNDPSSQMARLKAAGLNPNLVYGNGVVGNTSGPAPQYDAPHLQSYQQFGDLGVGQAMSVYQNARMNDSAIKKNEAETENILSTKGLTDVQTQLKKIDLYREQWKNEPTDDGKSFWQSMMEMEKEKLALGNANITEDTNVKKSMWHESKVRQQQILVNTQLLRNKIVTEQYTQKQIQAFTAKLFSDIRRNEVLNSLAPYQVAQLEAAVIEASARTRNLNSQSRRNAVESAIREKLLYNGIDLDNRGWMNTGASLDKGAAILDYVRGITSPYVEDLKSIFFNILGL